MRLSYGLNLIVFVEPKFSLIGSLFDVPGVRLIDENAFEDLTTTEVLHGRSGGFKILLKAYLAQE